MRFIYGLLETEETPVSAIMTPRREIFALEDAPITKDLVRTIKNKGFSRIPVYRGDLDHLLGILHVKDLLRWQLEGRQRRLADLVRAPFFVPEMMRVRTLLEEFQKRRLKFSLVVDEYGTIVGLVTLEDVLEELFGEIYDEFDRPEAPFKEISPGVYLLSPRLRVEEFNRLTGADLPSEEFETMGGLVLSLFGELPREGMSREAYGFRFVAEKVRGTRIQRLRVERLS
jgi:CBS domain containing-hemolysin-like protein